MAFVFAGVLCLANAQPEWWSIATLVIVFAAAAAFFGRGLYEWRRPQPERTGEQ